MLFRSASKTKGFLIGDPLGIHIFWLSAGVYISDGNTDYLIGYFNLYRNGFDFYGLTVSNDDVPIAKFYLDEQLMQVTTLTGFTTPPMTNKSYIFGIPPQFLMGSMGKAVSDISIFSRELEHREIRDLRYGYKGDNI